MKQILFYFITIFITTTALSQSCDVYVDSLKGQYTGGCKDGEANGNGTAKGTDSYTGNFKNGYPDGEGKYTWKNGSTYEGSWKNGLFEGVGTLNKVDNTTGKSIVMSGFWKKGKYIGKYEKPYVIHFPTNNINDINIRSINKTKHEVTINVKSITGGGADQSSVSLPKPRLTGVETIKGTFDQQVSDETASTIANTYTLRDVTFPFYAIFTFEATGTRLHAEKVGIELLEDGNWYIHIGIDN